MRNLRPVGSCLIALTPILVGGCGQGPMAKMFGSPAERTAVAPNGNTVEDAPSPMALDTAAAPTNGPLDAASWEAPATANDEHRRLDAPPGPRFSLFGEVDGTPALGRTGAAESVAQVTFAVEGSDFDPDVDSTGRFIVYASTQHAPTADIYIKGVDGRSVTQLTSDPADDVMPAFSPDDAQIAFCSNRAGQWDVYVMDAAGGPAVQVTNDPAHEIHPSWSPDGRFMVYSKLGEQSGRWEMWVTEVGNYSVRRFIGYGLFPEWCPDPARPKIVFQKARDRGSRLFGVWTIDYENGEGHRPTEIASAANAAAINPSWSPDGRLIAFTTVVDPNSTSMTRPEWADVWIVSADGGAKVNLTQGEHANVLPTWGGDGRVYFVSNRSGRDNVWAMEPERAIAAALGGDGAAVAGVPTE